MAEERVRAVGEPRPAPEAAEVALDVLLGLEKQGPEGFRHPHGVEFRVSPPCHTPALPRLRRFYAPRQAGQVQFTLPIRLGA